MSRYTHESPMDFQFENGTGPVDGRSPFAQVSANSQRFPTTSSPSKKSEYHSTSIYQRQRELTCSDVGPYSVFESPAKSVMGAHPSSPEKRLPPTPAAFNTLFNTPRKPKKDIDDSSAGETPKSPEGRDESDATPENRNRQRALITFDDDGAQAESGAQRRRGSPIKDRPTAQRRDSLLLQLYTKAKNKVYSPGRGEVPRKDHSGAIEKVARRRKRDVDHRVARRRRHSMSDSDADYEPPTRSPRKASGQPLESMETKSHWLPSAMTFIAQHPTLPATLTSYAQFLFNVFLLMVLAWWIYGFWSAIIGDVNEMSNKEMAKIMSEIAACTRDYNANGCDSTNLYPVMIAICDQYKKCMEQDYKKVGRANISARTFAQIFNSFVEPISYKAMIFTAVLVFGCFAISNLAFGLIRHKMQAPCQPPPYGYQSPPPPTPQRSMSGQDGAFYAGTPWHQPPIGFEPQPSGGFGQIEGQGSPQRRLVYN